MDLNETWYTYSYNTGQQDQFITLFVHFGFVAGGHAGNS